MIHKQKRSGVNHNWNLTANPGYEHVESFARGITWYKTETKDVFSGTSFKLKNENNELVSFNSQTISFRLSIKEH